jgi:hypothetical protein
MSVLVIAKLYGDTVQFRQAFAERGDEFEKISASSRAAGAISHRFGIGDGFALVQDEWDSVEHFHAFFSDPSLQAFIGSVGGAPMPPEVILAEAVTAPGQF